MRIAPLLPLAFTLSACNDKADPAADTDLPIDADADADTNGDADSDASWPSINPDSVHHCPLSRRENLRCQKIRKVGQTGRLRIAVVREIKFGGLLRVMNRPDNLLTCRSVVWAGAVLIVARA